MILFYLSNACVLLFVIAHDFNEMNCEVSHLSVFKETEKQIEHAHLEVCTTH